ncbi:sugar transferase [Spirosoma arcticum]
MSWLNGDQKADLIITDQCNGQRLVLMARENLNYQFIPVLVTCLSTETSLIENTLRIKATDLLVVNEDDQSLESKIRYYLKVSTVVSATYGLRPSPSVYRLRLPWWKRAIDIGVSLTVLLLLSPLLLVVALLIVLDSKGPVFYKSKRAGANYYIFNMYKFRSMKVQADRLLSDLSLDNLYAKPADSDNDDTAGDNLNEYLCSACRQRGVSCQHPLFDQDQPICEKLYMQENEELATFMKFRNDPRITRLGTFLRNSSIDELPQLVNVLIGDMSLVGNRPLPLYEAEKLTADESVKRFAGPAGLTGIWQTKKRAKGQGPMSERERILLDIEYASTFSFKTDMYIIWKTFFSLWQKENV